MSVRYGTNDRSDEDEVDEESHGIHFPDEGHVVAGVVAEVGRKKILVDIGLETLARVPMRELPAEVEGKPREALSVGDKIEAVVLDSRYGRVPILSVALLQERLAWSEHPAGRAQLPATPLTAAHQATLGAVDRQSLSTLTSPNPKSRICRNLENAPCRTRPNPSSSTLSSFSSPIVGSLSTPTSLCTAPPAL